MAVGIGVLRFVGNILRHLAGIFLLCWRRMTQTALIVAAATLVLAEIAASLATRSLLAPVAGHVVVAILCVVMAYGAALTVLIAELLIGLRDTIRVLEGDAEAGMRAAAAIAERDAGTHGVLGLLASVPVLAKLSGLPTVTSASRSVAAPMSTSNAQRTVKPSTAPGASRLPSRAEAAAALAATTQPLGAPLTSPNRKWPAPTTSDDSTRREIAATDEFISTAPRPRIGAQPVRADNLPRITWAYEQPEDLPVRVESPTPGAAAPTSYPDVAAAGNAEPLVSPVRVVPVATPTTRPIPATEPDDPPARTDDGIRDDIPAMPPLPRHTGQPGAVTRPLPFDGAVWSPPVTVNVTTEPPKRGGGESRSPRQTIPLAETSGGRGVWARISQVLAGSVPAQPLPPLHTEPTEPTEPTAEDAPPAQ